MAVSKISVFQKFVKEWELRREEANIISNKINELRDMFYKEEWSSSFSKILMKHGKYFQNYHRNIK